MTNFLVVAAGGAIGAMLRYALTGAVAYTGLSFPLGTLLANTLGSFVIGLLAAFWMFSGEPAPAVRLFVQTGLLGAFTTFAAFSLETLTLWQNGQVWLAMLNTTLSVVLCLFSVVSGVALVSAIYK